MDAAALVALRSPVQLDLAGLLYEVPPRPVLAWVRASTDPLPLLALLSKGQARRLSARLHDEDDEVDLEHLVGGWREAIAAHSGLPWWVAERLLGQLIAGWDMVAGELILRGTDLPLLPLDAALLAILALTRRSAKDKAETDRLLHALWEPPAGVVDVATAEPPGFSAEEQGAAFRAAAATYGRGPSSAR